MEGDVEDAQRGDLPSILSIYYRNMLELLGLPGIEDLLDYERRVEGDDYRFLSPANLADWYDNHRNECDFILVARVDGKIVGFVASSMVDNGLGYIEELHVERAWRGNGVGSALLRAAEERLRRCGCGAAYLEAHQWSRPFFERHGYRVVDPNGGEEGRLVYVIMAKRLRSR